MNTNTPPGPNESSSYDDEVLNASWLPGMQVGLGLNTPRPSLRRSTVDDPDTFLQRIYRVQE